jgi:SAM-dependent methyltransferase
LAEATSAQACQERHVDYPDRWLVGMDGLQRARMEALYGQVRGRTALDVGCNSGYAAILRPDVAWSGVDVAPALVAVAGERMAARVAPAEALPFPDASFDTVVLGEILEHVYDPAAVVAEAVRVARLAVVGSTPAADGGWGKHTVAGHRWHVRAFDEGELMELLSPFGAATIRRLRDHFQLFEVAL